MRVCASAETTRTSSGRQSPTAHRGSGSPHSGWEPTGCRVSPSTPVAPHGADGAVSPGRRGGAAPSHQPPHRRLHKLWTTSAPYEPVPHAAMKAALGNVAGAVCAPSNAPRRIHLPSTGVAPERTRTPGRDKEIDIRAAAAHQATSTRMRPRSAPPKPPTRPQLPGWKRGYAETSGIDFRPNRSGEITLEHAPYRLCAPPWGVRSGRRSSSPGPFRRPRG